jgi:hypothetical protein
MITKKGTLSKRILNVDFFKKGKMVSSSRNSLLKLEKVNQVKSAKISAECERLITSFETKLKIPDSRVRKIQLERLAKRIREWQKNLMSIFTQKCKSLKKRIQIILHTKEYMHYLTNLQSSKP